MTTSTPYCFHCGVLFANACTDCNAHEQWLKRYEGVAISSLPSDAPPLAICFYGEDATGPNIRVRVHCTYCFASAPSVGNDIDAAIAEWNKLHTGPHRAWVRVPQ